MVPFSHGSGDPFQVYSKDRLWGCTVKAPAALAKAMPTPHIPPNAFGGDACEGGVGGALPYVRAALGPENAGTGLSDGVAGVSFSSISGCSAWESVCGLRLAD